MLIKTHIPSTQMDFATGIISKYSFYDRFSSKNASQKNACSFRGRLGFIYASPLIRIKRNTFILQKTEALRAANIQIQSNISTQQFKFTAFTVNSQAFTLLNNFTFAAFDLHNAFSYLRMKPQNQEKLLRTSARRKVVNNAVNENRIGLIRSLQIENTQIAHKVLSRKRSRINLDTSRFFTNLLINRVHLTENNAAKTKQVLTSKVQNALEDSLGQRAEPGLGSYELATTKVVRTPPQLKKGGAEQVDFESAHCVPSQTREKLPVSDINSLAEKVYQLIERKARIERERRG